MTDFHDNQTESIDTDRNDFEDAIAAWEADIERRRERHERAREILNEEALPRASRLLWNDAAEVYAVCESCHVDYRDSQWTGTTENLDYWELREIMRERLTEGVPCAFCKREEINEIADELAVTDDDEVRASE